MDGPEDTLGNRLRIAQVVSGISRSDAGPSYSVTRLSEALAKSHDVTLHALEPRPQSQPSVDAVFYEQLPIARSLGISPAMKRGLFRAAPKIDTMHFHGLWMMPNVYPKQAVRGTDCALVMSPRGMLDPWALRWSSRRKAIFRRFLQNSVLDAVDCFHATSEKEALAIREAGYTAPIAVIPIGVDVPPKIKKHPTEQRTLLYLGRLHPVKNVEGLIRAWATICGRHRDWRLVIAGPGERRYVANLRRIGAKVPGIEFRDPAYGQMKTELLASADLLVLPSHTENFGVVVSEALAHGVPVVSSTGAPWEGLVSNSCGWWTAVDHDSLVSILDLALSAPASELGSMGANGRAWMSRDFDWSLVARRTADVFAWLSCGNSRPDTVTT